jgi:hypothetical protein
MNMRLIINRLFVSTFLVLTLISCETELIVTESSFDATSEGMKATINIDVNNDWAASSSEEWCILSPTNGDKNVHAISLTVQRNHTYNDRECYITIQSKDKSETIIVKQKQLDGIVLETSSISISDKAQIFEITVNSNIVYDVSVSCDWLAVVNTKALTSRNLVFNAEENTSLEQRTGIISFKSKDEKMFNNVIVEQKQKDSIIPSKESICFGWESSSETLKIQSNVDFEIIIPDNYGWLHVVKRALSRGFYSLDVSVDSYVPTPESVADTNVSDRTGQVVLKYGDVLKEINVSQHFRDYIWLSQDYANLYVGESIVVTAKAYLHSGINDDLYWSSSDESVATVSNGSVHAIAKGTTEINVFNADKSYCAKIPVIVKKTTDDIYVSALGASISSNSLTLQSRLYWPSQVKSIVFYSVWLCYPDGTAYDIKGTSNGYVLFKPIYYSGSWDASMRSYFSRWFVVYQVEVDGEVLQYSAYVNPNIFTGGL